LAVSALVAHLVRDEGVNPATPTNEIKGLRNFEISRRALSRADWLVWSGDLDNLPNLCNVRATNTPIATTKTAAEVATSSTVTMI